MKALSFRLLLIIFVSLSSTKLTAATISGNISYTGTVNGKILVAVFDDLTLHSQPLHMIPMDSPGIYTSPDLADGTYYIVSSMSSGEDYEITKLDPWGVYGTLENLTPVEITSGNNVTGINITLVEATEENPNPFYEENIAPTLSIQLPEIVQLGKNPSLYSDGSSIFLYKHDGAGADGAKIFKIDPSSGEIINTYSLTLESFAGKICWIDALTFHNADLWASGGYGSSEGTGWIEGIFKIDIGSSSASNQLPIQEGLELTGSLASDGENLYSGVDMETGSGIIKFNPNQVSELPASPFLEYESSSKHLCFANNYLWVGLDFINKYDPVNGIFMEGSNLPESAAELYFNEMFWEYDETNNRLNAYSLNLANADEEKYIHALPDFTLEQNFPNPFNPVTHIKYSIPTDGMVSLKVYNLIGQEVSVIFEGEQTAGTFNAVFDASDLSSGVYLYQIKSGSFVSTKKFILLK